MRLIARTMHNPKDSPLDVPNILEKSLARTGVAFEKSSSKYGEIYRSADFDRGKGFQFEILESSIQHILIFSLERFAADLAKLIRNQLLKEVDKFSSPDFAEKFGEALTLRINDSAVPNLATAIDIQDWRNMSLMAWVDKPVKEIEASRSFDFLLTFVLTCLPIEIDGDDVEEDTGSDFSIEGAKKSGVFTVYERSKKNRSICLAVQGYDCKVCGLNMEEKYGSLGSSYIHVHHLQPVSRMTSPRAVNPLTELIPVCPNCHYMMHQTDPPVTPAELRMQVVKEASDFESNGSNDHRTD